MHQGKPILFQKECCMRKRVAYILEKTIVSREYCISLKQFIAFKETPRPSTHSRGNTILLGEKDRYIHKKNQSWNLEWCFNLNAWGNLAPFLKRWCTFLKENIADSYQHTHITSKNVVITTIRYMQMDLNLTWCWNLLAEGAILLWSCIRIEDRFQNIAFLEKYNLGSQIGVYILCKKKTAEPTSWVYFVCLILFHFPVLFVQSAKFLGKLTENKWNTKLPSTHAQVSDHLIFPNWGPEGGN